MKGLMECLGGGGGKHQRDDVGTKVGMVRERGRWLCWHMHDHSTVIMTRIMYVLVIIAYK